MFVSGHGAGRSRALALLPTSLRASSSSPSSIPSSSRLASSYHPSSTSTSTPSRPPRPSSPSFFTGRPDFHDSLTHLTSTLSRAQSLLRAAHIYPLPSTLPYLQPPAVSWKAAENLGFNTRGAGEYRQVIDVLNEMHHLRYVASTAGSGDVARLLDTVLGAYERADRSEASSGAAVDAEGVEEAKGKEGIDELGRSYAMGRRKTSSARVWMVPVSVSTDAETPSTLPQPGQILVNHLPLADHFSRTTDRDLVLRPFRLTGLIGAYNVFALVRGGGTTGQAGALSLAVARALAQIRDDVVPVLENDGALMRDTRMVERKKTGLAKARKRYTWVKR